MPSLNTFRVFPVRKLHPWQRLCAEIWALRELMYTPRVQMYPYLQGFLPPCFCSFSLHPFILHIPGIKYSLQRSSCVSSQHSHWAPCIVSNILKPPSILSRSRKHGQFKPVWLPRYVGWILHIAWTMHVWSLSLKTQIGNQSNILFLLGQYQWECHQSVL